MAKSYDADAEDTFIRAILYGVNFDDLVKHVVPDMMYGQMHGEDWTPIARKLIYSTALGLYHQLRAMPSKDSLIASVGMSGVQIANVKADMIVSLVERIWNLGKPEISDAVDSRIRIYKSYTMRYAAEVLEKSAKHLETGDGEGAIKLMHEQSVLKISTTQDYTVVNYVESLQSRIDHVRAVQRGDDLSVQKVPFGIRGLDAETGGMGAGELIIGALAPGRGKSITVQDSCAHNVEHKNGAVMFTKEMTDLEVGLRFDSRFTGLMHPKLHQAQIVESDFEVWKSKVGSLGDYLRIVVMKRDFTPQRMRSILQSLDWTFYTRVVYCDYLNIMHPSEERDRHKPSYESGGILCEELKDLAVERNHPLMTMCQLKPQSSDKLHITYDDIALNKLAVSANANVVFGILADKWLQQMGKAVLQILKIRQKQPENEMWNMFPALNYIRIDTNVHGLANHPAPQFQQQFHASNMQAMENKFGKKEDKNIRVIDADGKPRA